MRMKELITWWRNVPEFEKSGLATLILIVGAVIVFSFGVMLGQALA